MKAGQYAIIDPAARIASSAQVCEFVLVRPDAIIGEGVVLKPFCIVSRDCVVGDGTVIGPGAMLLHERPGGTHDPSFVGKRCFVGSQAVILPGITVCDDVVIGACSLVTHNITEPGVYMGVPCRKLGSIRL